MLGINFLINILSSLWYHDYDSSLHCITVSFENISEFKNCFQLLTKPKYHCWMFEIVHFQKITFKCWEYSSKFKSIWTVLFVIIFDPLFTATNEKPVLYSINQSEERITVCTELQDPRLWLCCHHWLTQESEIIIINYQSWDLDHDSTWG